MPARQGPRILGTYMRRIVLGALIVASCGTKGSGLVTTTPGADGGVEAGAAAQDGAGAAWDAPPGELDVSLEDGAPPAPDVARGEAAPADVAPAGPDRAPADAGSEAGVDATTRWITACADDPALACGPRNERFPWTCLGQLCTSDMKLPSECAAFSPFLGCACDMVPDISMPTRCFAGGPAAGASTFSVGAQTGVACRTTQDCADRLTDLIVCGPKGLCVRKNGGRCASNPDCVSGFCSLVEGTCGGARFEPCMANRECASYECKAGACQ